MQALHYETVTYARSSDTVELDATPGVCDLDMIAPGVAVTQGDYRDWMITVSDLVLDGSAVRPKINDTITDGNGTIWTVTSIGEIAPCYDYVSSARDRFRVHTRRT